MKDKTTTPEPSSESGLPRDKEDDGNPVRLYTHSDSGSGQDEKVVRLGRDIQAKIGQNLRTLYDEIVKEGVPDRLNMLLQRLDSAEKKGSDK